MEENQSRISRRKRTHESSRGKHTRKSRYPVQEDDDDDDRIKCSGKNCRSCTGGMIADCVAVCCCPCAVVNLLALAFVKVPWMVGRKCLGLGKKNQRKKLEMKRKCEKDERELDSMGGKLSSEISCEFGEEEGKDNVCPRSEAEKVWLELYQVGQLGFGRVSSSGNHTEERDN